MVDCSSEKTLIDDRKNRPWRITHLLKPSIPTSKPPQIPFKPETQNIQSSSTVNFHGWRRPLEKWRFWVQKLLPTFESSWKKNSIFEPIMASTFEIPRCTDTIFALAERWRPEKSSFLLPWGEVTITLEDIMVLGGYSVLGDSVLGSEISEEMREIELDLETVRMMIMHSKAKRADQNQWMNAWMGKDRKFEHEAFLSLWLSRYVMPSVSYGTIRNNVFPIAIRLAKGGEFAFAPAILATIYRDLRLLKHKIEAGGNLEKLNLWAPLQLLQIWVWERFPKLSPTPNVFIDGQPRLAKWHKAKILRRKNVGLDIDSAKESIQWRPYLDKSSLLAKDYLKKDLQCYARLVRVSYLVGFDQGCIERYLPRRVSMQFGLEQDIPCDLPQLSNNSSDIAWKNYNRPIEDVKLVVPSRFCESGLTSSTKDDVKTSSISDLSEKMRIKLENEADVPPGYEPRGKRIKLEEEDGDANDDDNRTLSQVRAKRMNRGTQSPLASAGDNECVQDEQNIETTEQGGFVVENESEKLNKIRSKIIEDKNDLLRRVSTI